MEETVKLLKFGECKVCDKPCIWIPSVDGVLAKKEVCSLECLERLTNGEVEIKQDEE